MQIHNAGRIQQKLLLKRTRMKNITLLQLWETIVHFYNTAPAWQSIALTVILLFVACWVLRQCYEILTDK